MKNLLFILTDELRSDIALHTGRYPFVRTPHLDQIRAEGVTVRNHFCQYPVCGPSRASLLTGTYPQENGVLDNNSLLPDTARTWGHHLADLGYEVDAFGKTHGMNPGFRQHPEPPALASLGTENMGYEAPSDQIVGLFGGGVEQYYDSLVTREVTTALAARTPADPPFAMFVGLHAPHPPLYPPPEFAGLYDADVPGLPEPDDDMEPGKPQMQYRLAQRRWLCHPAAVRRQMIANYLALVTLVDGCLGRMMDALRQTGQLDETLVVITSDHGDQLGEHQLIGKFNNFYEGTIRTPLVLRLPGGAFAGRELDTFVEMVDLYPTLCELLDVPAPRGLSGRSFVPGIRDPQTEHRAHISCMMRGGQMVRTRDWKLAYYPDDQSELYDLRHDPGEKRNRCDDPDLAPLRHELMTHLLDHLIRFHRPPSHAGLNQ